MVRSVDFFFLLGSGEEEGRERKRRDKKEGRRSSRDDREDDDDRHKKRKKGKHSDREKGKGWVPKSLQLLFSLSETVDAYFCLYKWF